MTQIRFDGRRFENLPLSPAHRTPVFEHEYTPARDPMTRGGGWRGSADA